MRWVLIGFVVLSGCAGRASDPARETQRALETALRGGDVAALAELLGVPEAEVATGSAEAREELAMLADRIADAPLEHRARVYDGDLPLELVREAEGWRVDRGLPGAASTSRPEDVIVALHHALARARWAELAALLASDARRGVEDEARRWLEGTRDVDALEVSVTGESATVRTPTGGIVDLVREAGEWRIVELR